MAVYCDAGPGQTSEWFGQNSKILGVLYEGKRKDLCGDHDCPFVRPSVTYGRRLNCLSDFHDIRDWRFYRKSWSTHEFLENLDSESDTLFKGVN